jgi:hypothetical protein
MLAMMRLWLTDRPLFQALHTLARAAGAMPRSHSGRVSPVDRQKLNVMFWTRYDDAGGWR